MSWLDGKEYEAVLACTVLQKGLFIMLYYFTLLDCIQEQTKIALISR